MKRKIFLLIVSYLLSFINVYAETLTYNGTLKDAIKNSFDLKISKVDIDISKSQLKAVRSELLPTLSLQFNTEYNKYLQDGYGTYAYAGNTMITPYTQFRDMLYLTLSYNILDFGVAGKKVQIAKKEIKQKEIQYDIQLKDLKLKILDLYTKTYLNSNVISAKSEILKIYENMFHNKEKIFKAGISDKLSVMDEAVKIAKTQNDIENSKMELKANLKDLSYYTHQQYNANEINLTNINSTEDDDRFIYIEDDDLFFSTVEKDEFDFNFDKYLTLESEYYDLEIAKKKDELSILKRQLLPTFRLYTGYSLYGQNPNQYWASVKDIDQRSFVVGISSNYVLFDGFKNRATREKTRFEIEKLQYEKEKKLAEIQKEFDKTYSSYESYNEELLIKQNMLSTVKEKLDAVNRLSTNKLIEQNELLTVKADLLSQELELKNNIINISSKLEEMKIMSGWNL